MDDKLFALTAGCSWSSVLTARFGGWLCSAATWRMQAFADLAASLNTYAEHKHLSTSMLEMLRWDMIEFCEAVMPKVHEPFQSAMVNAIEGVQWDEIALELLAQWRMRRLKQRG